MYGKYANIWGILMVNVTIYSIRGSCGKWIAWIAIALATAMLPEGYPRAFQELIVKSLIAVETPVARASKRQLQRDERKVERYDAM